jgi:MFS family permease
LALLVGLILIARIAGEASPGIFALSLAVAAGLWLIAAGLFASVAETPGATEGGRDALQAAQRRVDLLRTDAPFRRFVAARALLISTGLAGPYYVLLARETGGGHLLGLFVLASGLASALSSAFWGHFADRSSRSVLVVAAAIASGLGILMFLLDALGTLRTGYGWLVPVAYFALAVVHSGVRIGRKTYVLDLAGAEHRTDYIAVSNTLIGAVLLLSDVVGALTPWLGGAGMLLLLSFFGFCGVVLGMRLPEVE